MNTDFVAVIAAIDRVHGISRDLPEIPLINVGIVTEVERREADAWLSVFTDFDGEVLPHAIAVKMRTPYRRLKGLHEIGHYADGWALPGRGFSSLHAPGLAAWRLAVSKSRLFAELAEAEAGLVGRDRERLADARRPGELWARSYAQFVATRSGDLDLLVGIRETRIARVGGLRFPLQWADDDVASIADATVALFVWGTRMDYPPLDAETERLVQEVVTKYGCGRDEAILAVALEHGEVFGAGDLVSIRPLTPEQRRLFGVDHDPDQIAAETRARAAARALAAERGET